MENLFGETIIKDVLLRDTFIEPPFSVLDTKTGSWQNRKKQWKALGMLSEIGRDENLTFNMSDIHQYYVKEGKMKESAVQGTSIFDPALCELIYHWFCIPGGVIYDCFAGGVVRGLVAAYLGYSYIGIEIRPEQVDSNRQQAAAILKGKPQLSEWICGDSRKEVCNLPGLCDLLFSCPPYADLEIYSDISGDISNLKYAEFKIAYEDIIKKSVAKIKPGGFACFVVGEVRDKNGNYIGFVPFTIACFIRAGMSYYNEAILLNPVASASARAAGNMKSKKLVKIHQNVLVFKKP